MVARAKIILRLRETMYEHPSSLEEEKNALVAKVDEIVRTGTPAALLLPTRVGSDEAQPPVRCVFRLPEPRYSGSS